MKSKIVIIGAGHVGSHCALSLAIQGICDEIVLIDVEQEKASAHAKDIADGTSLMAKEVKVRVGAYCDCDDANIVIISIGVSRKPGQTRLDMLEDTITIMEDVMPKLCASAFDGILLTISNPADIVTHYAAKHSHYGAHRVFGTGTSLDTLRLKRTLSEISGIAQKDIVCFSMGEHGNSSMIPFSQVTLNNKPFFDYDIDENYVLTQTRMIGNEIIEGKGSTEFGIGMACAKICNAILHDTKEVLLVSAALQGEYGYDDIHVGVPCVISSNGIEKVVQLNLSEKERKAFHESIEVIKEYNRKVK